MSDEADWRFGRKELLSILIGGAVFAALSLVLHAAPPWWFLPASFGRQNRRLRRQHHFNVWELYAQQGGYSEFWLQSLIGWLMVGAVGGLIFSNLVLRGKSWD